MKFTFKIASEEMKTACEKLRFGGGNAVSFRFMKDQDGKPAVSMITSDGISQCQTNPISISIKEAPHNGTYHISFRKKEDGVMMCICSTLATAFFGY